ncbi:MAG: hypothetical protein O2821_06165 [Chloroflexi bacterium]|nr:hypothetical protein [Chloroflexota bacterium]MDA1226328.1 hypothetical protein [Chloroflexota bacterium]
MRLNSVPVNGLREPGLLLGALAGALATPPVVGLMYLLDKAAGFPFVPFALFDWTARVLPGPVVTFGIDLMIDGMRLVGLSVADSAKTGEQMAAVLMFFVICVAAVALLFRIIRAKATAPSYSAGLVFGAVLGVPLVAVSLPMGQSSLHPVLILFGLMILFLLWGLSLVPIYRRLMIKAEPDALVSATEAPSVQTINRRQFLIRMGATTATITVLGGGLGACRPSAKVGHKWT